LPLESLLARLAGEITSQTLKLDPTSHPRLESLAGTRIRFDVLPPVVPGLPNTEADSRTLLLTVEEDAVTVESGGNAQTHAVVRGTLPEIARSFLSPSAENAPRITIEGDEAALQAVAALFRDLQPDFAEPLAKVVGREAADNLIGAAEAGFALLRSAAESLATGARKDAQSTWLTEPEKNSLMNRLDDLRLRVDRLDARIRLAEERAASTPEAR